MKHILKFTLPALALCAAVACSKTAVEPENPHAGKELISFAGEGDAMTKAAGFTVDTKVVMRIKAEATGKTPRYAEAVANALAVSNATDLSKLDYISGKERYWDDAFGRESKLTVYAFAIPGKTDATLPVWSKEGWTAVDTDTNPNWFEGTDYTTVAWSVSAAQTKNTMAVEDLTYSNNISKDGKGGRYSNVYNSADGKWEAKDFENGQLQWVPKTENAGETTGKFDKGHLEFKHALAKIEINLKEGVGFNNASNADFKWSKNQTFENVAQNITLKSFYTGGTFDVSKGEWVSSSLTSTAITEMNETEKALDPKSIRQLFAYVLPGNNLYETTANVVEFEIDNAKYYVTGQQIANAIRKYYENDENSAYKTFTTIEAGKHYIINLSVGKKSIDRITAAIVDWEKVNSSDATAQNTYPEFTFDDRTTQLGENGGSKFNLYRAAKTAANYIDGNTEANYNWASGYTTDGAATKEWDSTNKLWKTNWFWENNLTYYHFRAAGYDENTTGIPTVSVTKDETNGDYFEIAAGELNNSAYKDWLWGAPFKKSTGLLSYSKDYGFDNSDTNHQIAQAIGATVSTINLKLFHVTSQITVNVVTKNETDPSRVILKDGDVTTKVEILNFLPTGTVLMGTGLVSATGDTREAAVEMTTGTYTAGTNEAGAKVENYKYGMVPQALSWTGGTIGLRITTPDNNQYLVKDLSACTAAVTTNYLTNPYTKDASDRDIIDAWYPGFQYTYTITVKKTGVERITAAVVGWETVEGTNIEIDLEN